MPIRAKLILDSGCFLPRDPNEPEYCRIGLFQCDKSCADITVRVDGVARNFPALNKLGRKCKIEVRHLNRNGSAKKGRVTYPKTFHRRLLELNDLYDQGVKVNEESFDCELHLRTGRFGSKDARRGRVFKKHARRAGGRAVLKASAAPREVSKPIMHDMVVWFELADGESLVFLRGGKQFWSSDEANPKHRIEITINADESTVPRYFGESFSTPMAELWLPNPSDPPPMCPNPPCDPQI